MEELLSQHRTRLGIVALTIFLDLLGFGIIIPLMPQYAESYGAGPLQIGLLMSCYSLMQFLFVPVWGRLSDRVGRRPILLISIAGSVLSFTLLGLSNSLVMLFFCRLLAGLTTANFSVAQAYVADVTAPEHRARGMGLVGAAFGLGFVVGPFVGGELYPLHLSLPLGLTVRSGTAPFFFAAILSAVNLALAYRRLPESLPVEKRGVVAGSGFFTAHRLVDAMRRPQVGALFSVFFLVTLAFSMMEATLILFGQARLAMTPVQAGRFLGYLGVLMVVVQGGMVGRLVRRFGEKRLLLAGGILMVPGFFLIAPVGEQLILSALRLLTVPESFLATPAAGYLALAIAMLPLAIGSGICQPSLNALVSRRSDTKDQGGVLGINQSLGSLARVLGPIIGTNAFREFGVGSPFLLGSVVIALATVLAFRSLRNLGPV
jgi:MFS transporter, DHA1 family, tetracycline resistance protein